MQITKNRIFLLLLVIAVITVYFLSQEEIRETLYDYIILALDLVANETPHMQQAGL